MLSNYKFEIEMSKDGLDVFKILKEDKKLYIGSKYKMQEKIDKFIYENKENIKDDTICIIFGIGSKEILNTFCKIYKENTILIFEPNKNVLQYVKMNKEKYNYIDNKRVILLGEEKNEIVTVLNKYISQYKVEKVKFIYLLNYVQIYSLQVKKFNEIFKEVITDIAINRNTNLKFSRIWFNTIMNNFKYILQAKTVDEFKNKFKNVPAIIVSAGPSLNKNINELKEIDNNLLILTGGRTLKALMDRDIKTHLIGVIDPLPESYDLVKGYINKTKCPLLFYEGTNEKVVEEHKGDKIVFTQNKLIYELFDKKVCNLGLGGSVAHTLTAMAIIAGCNPIIFVGQDLAYTDEKYHADIAINQFKNLEDNMITDTDQVYVDDINGNKVRTSLVLDGFRRDLEKIITNNPKITFINATEGGAKILGTKQMSLKEAISKYKIQKEKLEFNSKKNDIELKKIKQNAINILKESIEADNFIIKKCSVALKEIKTLELNVKLKNNNKIIKSLENLDKIDEEIRKKYKGLEFLESLIYPIVYNILNYSNVETKKDIIKKNKYMYTDILKTCKFALEFMNKTLEELTSL